MKASETTIRTDATTTAAATATGSEQASPNSHENRLPWYLREAAQHDSVHIQTYTGNFGKRKEEEKEPRGHGREDDPLRQPQPSVDQDQEEDDSDRARLFLCNDDEHHQRLDVPTTTGTFHSSSMLPTDSRTTGTGTHIHARECHGDADQNTHVHMHMHMHIHNHPTQPKRQKKRTRYPFEHDDAFVKFTGSMEDLKQKFQPIHAGHNAAADASDQEVSSVRTRFLATIRHYFAEGYGYHAVIINTCIPLWMLILFIMLLWVKRNRYVHSNVLSKHSRTMELDRGDDDKSSTRSETQSTMKTKCEQDDSQNGETIPNDNHATAVEPKDNKYLPPMEIRQEDDAENDRSDVAALCSMEIPAMADVIASRTGLNQQDSIRIATQEILAARRRAVEDARKEQVMRLDHLRKALDHALSLLQNRIVSTACGTHLILCIGIGCVTRILMSNPDIVLKWLRSGQDTETYVEVLYSIFVKDVSQAMILYLYLILTLNLFIFLRETLGPHIIFRFVDALIYIAVTMIPIQTYWAKHLLVYTLLPC